MQTWEFALKTSPLTDGQIEALEACTPESTIRLTATDDGMILAAVTSERISFAFTNVRDRIQELTETRPRIVKLWGARANTVADIVFQAAERLYGEADGPLLKHLCDMWQHEAWGMATTGAFGDLCSDGPGFPKPAVVVRHADAPAGVYLIETWTRIYRAAKAYLEDAGYAALAAAQDDEDLAFHEGMRERRRDTGDSEATHLSAENRDE